MVDYYSYLRSYEWYSQRQTALEAADWRCQLCNDDFNLHVHHRTYVNLGNEKPGDLTVLCKSCHKAFHEKEREKKLYSTKEWQAFLYQGNPIDDWQWWGSLDEVPYANKDDLRSKLLKNRLRQFADLALMEAEAVDWIKSGECRREDVRFLVHPTQGRPDNFQDYMVGWTGKRGATTFIASYYSIFTNFNDVSCNTTTFCIKEILD